MVTMSAGRQSPDRNGAKVVALRASTRHDAELSDESLARACASGDPAAIAALFDRLQQPVARYVHRLLGGGPDVEDLVQSTFVEIVRGNTVYDGRATVLTWVLAIATNIVRHHRRSRGRHFRLLSAVTHEPRAASEDPADQTDTRSRLDRACRALSDLSHPLREAFVLCEIEGLSARQAGEVLGTSDVAVWKRVSKARRALRLAVLEDER
jgi:RNA polymerase sigma-70 factor (ECF subfamily)